MFSCCKSGPKDVVHTTNQRETLMTVRQRERTSDAASQQTNHSPNQETVNNLHHQEAIENTNSKNSSRAASPVSITSVNNEESLQGNAPDPQIRHDESLRRELMLPEAMDHNSLETLVMVIPDNTETATNNEAHHELPEATGDTNSKNSSRAASLIR